MVLATSLAFFFIVFLLAVILTAIAWLAFVRNRAEADQAARAEAEETPQPSSVFSGTGTESELWRDDRLSSIGFVDSVLARFDVVTLLKQHLDQAQLDWSAGRMTSMMLLLGTITIAILMRLVPGWAAVIGGLFGASLPYQFVLRRRNARFLKFRENFPDVLDSLARALRAGYPLSAAMEMIAAETAAPVSEEMRRTSAEANLGRGWPKALEGLSIRVPLLEVNMFISAVQLHARTGGKLSEVIAGLAENMRESIALQGEVRALAAHGKLTGSILTILPIGIGVMMMFVSPNYMRVLFDHPWGKNMIGIAIGCLIAAHLVIQKIVDIEV